MEIHQIRAFLAVAEELHFGRAAERLHMAQPPLSRTIRQLERELGSALFVRTTRTVRLTPAGEALLDPARAVLDSCQDATEAIKRANLGDIGRVRVGFAGPSSHKLISQLAQQIRTTKPGIELVLQSATYANEALARVMDGSLDLALVRWVTPPPRISGRIVAREHPVVLLYRGHPFENRESVSMSELKDEKFISLPADPGANIRDMTFHWAFQAGFAPEVVQVAPDSWVISALVAAGVGISISYDSVARNFNDPNLVYIPLDVVHDPINVHLAWREDDEAPALLEVLAASKKVLPSVETAHS